MFMGNILFHYCDYYFSVRIKRMHIRLQKRDVEGEIPCTITTSIEGQERIKVAFKYFQITEN